MAVIMSVARRLQAEPPVIATTLQELAALYDPIGLDRRGGFARLPHAVALLKLLRNEARALPVGDDANAASLMRSLVSAAGITLAAADQVLTEGRALTASVVTLLERQRADPASLAGLLSRAEWLMDGWERICQLWSIEPTLTSRYDALAEIAILLPMIPDEISDWVGYFVQTDPPSQVSQALLKSEDWRTGHSVLDGIARNEAFLTA